MRRTVGRAAFFLIAGLVVVSAPTDRVVAAGAHDGIWVGSFTVTSGGTQFTYPVLLNLSIVDTEGSGVALLPDDLHGNPAALGYATLNSVVSKKKRLTVTVEVGDGTEARRLTLNLKTKKGTLRGTISSNRDDIGGGKVSLVRLDPVAALQQVWTGTVDDGGGTVPVALLLIDGKKPSGVGFIGAAFGDLRDLTLDATRMTGTLVTAAGDTAFDLTINRKGHLAGTAEGSAGGVVLYPAARPSPPRVAKLSPQELASGKFTEVSIKGKNLAPGGFLFTSDQAGVTAAPPSITSNKKGVVRILVDSAVPVGTEVALDVAAPDGSIDAGVARLTTGDSAPVSFGADLQPIFTTTCARTSCHVQPPQDDPLYPDGEAAGGLVLSSSAAFANLVGVPARAFPSLNRVEPFEPERSYLIKVLRGDPDAPTNRMPASGPPYLSDEVIALFIRWIEEGATRQ